MLGEAVFRGDCLTVAPLMQAEALASHSLETCSFGSPKCYDVSL